MIKPINQDERFLKYFIIISVILFHSVYKYIREMEFPGWA
jgi:hypothetical protein